MLWLGVGPRQWMLIAPASVLLRYAHAAECR
jgi:hypothetical protein